MSSDDPIEALVADCAAEPIHAPGAVQPHGALVVLDADGRIGTLSANAAELIGPAAGPEALGRPFGAVLGPEWEQALAEALDGHIAAVEVAGTAYECIASRSGDRVLFEVEPDPGTAAADRELFSVLDAFHGAHAHDELLGEAVATVARLTGFDRVMCYRFDPEWNGEVVAEVVAPGIASFDGLRFPASDIPPQARAQYERTPLRLIPDAAATPSPLLAADAGWGDLDLSDATLRAVSPVHLRYLRNMGVRSSMSVSLTVGGRLWGLIACHHCTAALRPSHRQRQAVRLVARTTSAVLAVLSTGARTEHRVGLLRRLDHLSEVLRSDDRRGPLEVLADHADEVLALVGATGLILGEGRDRHVVGEVPDDDVIAALARRARDGVGVVVDPALGRARPEGGGPAGALVVAGTGDRGLMWFRPESAETVRWAGDPTKRPDEETGKLEPRASFASYIEEVRGRAEPWTEEEVAIAVDLAARVAEADNLRVRREAEIAARLQQTLMLAGFPSVRGMTGAARYRPVSNSPLGGDWYDVFFRPDGTSIVAVGDVAGHGIEVASTMAQLRHALRAYLVRTPSLGDALARLNELLVTLLPNEMATVVLAEITPAEGTVRIANAGHLPAVVASARGSRLVEARGPSLGWTSDLPHAPMPVPIEAGERLVLYSDGLIERRTRPIDASLDALLAAADATVHLGIEEQADALLDRLTEGTDVDDDVTVVVVELVDERTAPDDDATTRPPVEVR